MKQTSDSSFLIYYCCNSRDAGEKSVKRMNPQIKAQRIISCRTEDRWISRSMTALALIFFSDATAKLRVEYYQMKWQIEYEVTRKLSSYMVKIPAHESQRARYYPTVATRNIRGKYYCPRRRRITQMNLQVKIRYMFVIPKKSTS